MSHQWSPGDPREGGHCRVQRTFLPLRGRPGFPSPGIRCEAPGKSYRSLRRTPRAAPRSRGVRGGPGARVSQASSDPGAQRSRGVGVRVGGRCQGWGAAPLPSPPGGGRAGWGARALRTGSSCGLWGPWRAGRASWGLGLRSRLRSPALLRAPRRQRVECGREELEGCSRTDKDTAPARGGRAGVGGGRRLAALGLLGASVPWRPRLGLAGLVSVPPSLALSVPLQPSSISLAPSPRVSLCLCLAPSLRVSPSGPSLGVPSPSPRPGTGARARGGRAQETVANERRRACSRPGGGRGVRARTAGAAWGPPADSPELEAALLMESSREDNGGRPRGDGPRGPGTLTLTPSWPGCLEFHGEAVRSWRE